MAGKVSTLSDQENSQHPSVELDDRVHQRVRLGILTVLAESGRADFGFLKVVLSLSDGNLGRHLEVLAGEGFITIVKGYEGKRPRTWAKITSTGRAALAAEIEAMKLIVRLYEDTKEPSRRPRRTGPHAEA